MHILYTMYIYMSSRSHHVIYQSSVFDQAWVVPDFAIWGVFLNKASYRQGPFNPWHQGSRVSRFRNCKHPGESDFRLFSGKSWVQWFRLQSDMFKTSWVSNSKTASWCDFHSDSHRRMRSYHSQRQSICRHFLQVPTSHRLLSAAWVGPSPVMKWSSWAIERGQPKLGTAISQSRVQTTRLRNRNGKRLQFWWDFFFRFGVDAAVDALRQSVGEQNLRKKGLCSFSSWLDFESLMICTGYEKWLL